MRAKFDSREAFALYFVMLGFLVIFFVMGLYLGRTYFAEEGVQNAPAEGLTAHAESVEDLSSELEFYENLSAPMDADSSEEPPPEAAPDPQSSPLLVEEAEETAPPPEPAPVSGPSGYTIQVAAYSTETEAEQTKLRLEAKDFNAVIIRPNGGLGDRFYRVWVGRYSTIEEAHQAERKLKEAGFPTFVRKTDE